MKLKNIIFVIITILTFSICYSELGPKAFSFSHLTRKVTLVVKGTVNEVILEKNEYIIKFSVEKYIKGLDENEITIFSPLYNGAEIDDEFYPEVNRTAILFLSSENGKYSIINGVAGCFSVEDLDDIEQIILTIGNNNEFFSAVNKESIKNLYTTLKSDNCKRRILTDLDGLLNSDDSFFYRLY